MQNYNLGTKYKGYQRTRLLLQITKQAKSPHVNGRLKFRQNDLVFRKENSDFSEMRIYHRNISPPHNSWVKFDGTSAFYEGYNGRFTPDYAEASNNAFKQPFIDDSMIKALAHAGSIETNLLDMYRTRQQTVDMCVSAVRRLTDAFLYMKRKDWRGACRTLGINFRAVSKRNRNNLPGAWLEYIYGWKPLVMDIYKLVDHPFPEPFKRVSGKSETFFSSVDEFFPPNGVGIAHRRVKNLHVVCRTKFDVFVNGAALAAASQYGLTNPAALAWEALPFSFVVDWFYDVGSFLERFTATSSLMFRNGIRALTMSYDIQRFHVAMGSGDSGNGTSSSVVRYKDRLQATPQFVYPRFKNPIDLYHMVTSLALMSKAFLKH